MVTRHQPKGAIASDRISDLSTRRIDGFGASTGRIDGFGASVGRIDGFGASAGRIDGFGASAGRIDDYCTSTKSLQVQMIRYRTYRLEIDCFGTSARGCKCR